MFCFAAKEIRAILYIVIKRNAEIINSEMEEVQCSIYTFLFWIQAKLNNIILPYKNEMFLLVNSTVGRYWS